MLLDRLLRNMTQYKITILHESVHAYLIYILRGEPVGDMKKGLDAYIDKNKFPNTFDNHLNHNFMAQFVDAIAYKLRAWDSNFRTRGSLDWQYYKDMAWGGLTIEKNGDFYKEFLEQNWSSSDRNRIQDVIYDEANKTQNSSGNGQKCN